MLRIFVKIMHLKKDCVKVGLAFFLTHTVDFTSVATKTDGAFADQTLAGP